VLLPSLNRCTRLSRKFGFFRIAYQRCSFYSKYDTVYRY